MTSPARLKYNWCRPPAASREDYLCKSQQVSQIKYAVNNAVQMITSDREVQLIKVARAHPKAKLVLRTATDDFKAVCCLSVKFGAGFFFAAKELYIDVIGVSFHVGSGCTETLVHTISDTGCVFVIGAEAGFNTVSA